MKYLAFILLIGCRYNATVKRVMDGDSFYLINGQEIRLANIDCPECTRGHIQAFGYEAKQFSVKYLEGQEVALKSHGKDKYGRKICDVWISDGRYFNQMLIKAGLAYCYRQYCPDSLFQDELAAKAAKIGLWAFKSVSPYQFRHIRK